MMSDGSSGRGGLGAGWGRAGRAGYTRRPVGRTGCWRRGWGTEGRGEGQRESTTAQPKSPPPLNPLAYERRGIRRWGGAYSGSSVAPEVGSRGVVLQAILKLHRQLSWPQSREPR